MPAVASEPTPLRLVPAASLTSMPLEERWGESNLPVFRPLAELCGPEQAPIAMLSHSLASGMSMWDPQLTALQSRFRILRYDTRGHGGSDVPDGPYRLDDLVADAVAPRLSVMHAQ